MHRENAATTVALRGKAALLPVGGCRQHSVSRRRVACVVGARTFASPRYPWRLKNCTARSCFFAAARERNVPRFLRLPVLGSIFREYSRYSPDWSLRIMSFSILDYGTPPLAESSLRLPIV